MKMFTEVYLNYAVTTHKSKNERFKRMTRPLEDTDRGSEEAMWHFEPHYGRGTSLGAVGKHRLHSSAAHSVAATTSHTKPPSTGKSGQNTPHCRLSHGRAS